MEQNSPVEGSLASYRVLDLTDETGVLCTRVLADMGADVIRIEKPGGDPMRLIGPFWHDVAHPEKGLPWMMFNLNKRSITLDIETGRGQDIFKRLAGTADFVVECFAPGYMEGLGVGYSALSQANPGVVMTSITPFGLSGPYCDYRASDLIAMAMGGYLYMCGDGDRAPLWYALSLCHTMSGLWAAGGTMIAHHYRQATGRGQQVDVSMQESMSLLLVHAFPYWDLNRIVHRRAGAGTRRIVRGVAGIRQVSFPCKDGYISAFMPGEWFEPLVKWMDSEGMAGVLKDEKWKGRLMLDADPPLGQEEIDAINAVISAFFQTKTKAELYRGAQARHIGWAPLNTLEELFRDEQLAARDFFVTVEDRNLGGLMAYPGAPFKLSETPWSIRGLYPAAGQHNSEVYEKELGLAGSEIARLKRDGVI